MSDLDLEAPPEDLEGAVSPQDDETPLDDDQAAEDAEGDPGEDGEAPQAEIVQGMTPEALDRLRKKIETSANTWRKRLSDLLGEDFELLAPCELCGDEFPGFHWPADVMQPNTDTQARLLEVLREPAAPDYLPDGRVTTCRQCGGFGKTVTGSKVPNKEVITCVQCKGYGYTPPPIGSGEPAYVPVEGEVMDDGEPYKTPPADVDVWGSPRILPDGQENPNYGKMPQYKDASLP